MHIIAPVWSGGQFCSLNRIARDVDLTTNRQELIKLVGCAFEAMRANVAWP